MKVPKTMVRKPVATAVTTVAKVTEVAEDAGIAAVHLNNRLVRVQAQILKI